MGEQVGAACGWQKFRTVACWVTAVIFIFIGGVTLLGPAPRPGEASHPLLLLIGGIAVLPPVLARIRDRLPWTQPWPVPILFWMLLLAIFKALGPSSTPDKPAEVAATKAAQVGSVNPSPPGNPAALAAINERPQTAEANFAERAETYWIPEARNLPTSEPGDLDEYHLRFRDMGVLVDFLDDGYGLKLDAKQQAVRGSFATALSVKQAKLFPILRRAYGKIADERLFRQDIRVTVSGPSSDTITFTGPIFVRNANVADFQQGLVGELKTARFRQVRYRWSRYLSDAVLYTLDPPRDGTVGSTDVNGNFRKFGD